MSYHIGNDCWDNIIGVRGCDMQSPDFYINELGIDIKELNSIAGSDYDTGLDFFYEKLELSKKELAAKILSHFQDKFKTNSILKNIRVGKTKSNLTAKPASNNLKGIFYEICNEDSFLDLYVSDISLHLKQTGDVNVNVIDLLQGIVIDTIVVPAVADQIVTVYPHKTYKSSRRRLEIFIGYDSIVESVFTTISNPGCSGCSGGSHSAGMLNFSSKTLEPPYIKNSLKLISDTGGLSMNVSVNCNHTDWLCNIRGWITMPLAYKLASEIMEYSINKSRQEGLNSATNIYVQENQDRMVTYGNKYVTMMTDLFNTMQLPEDRRCFACSEPIKHLIGNI